MFKSFLLIITAFLLVSCGGGGGSDTVSSDGVSFTISSRNLTFVATQGDTAPPEQTIQLSTSTSGVFLNVEYSGAVSSAYYTVKSSTTAEVTVSVSSPSAYTSTGDLAGTVTIYYCKDAGCSQQYSASPVTVDVLYKINGLAVDVIDPDVTSILPVFYYDANGVVGPSSYDINLSDIYGDSYGWQVSSITDIDLGAVPLNWLQVTPSSGTTLPAVLKLEVVPPWPDSGVYGVKLEITGDNGAVYTADTFFFPQ